MLKDELVEYNEKIKKLKREKGSVRPDHRDQLVSSKGDESADDE